MDNYSYQLYSQILKLFWRVFLAILGIAALIVIFPYVKSVVVMFVIALLLAMLLNPAVDFMESRGINRGLQS